MNDRRRVVLWGLLAAKQLGHWGAQWDIEWHVRIGRDSFWIAPHLLIYGGVTLIVLLSFGLLARDTLRYRGARVPAPPTTLRVLGFTSTRAVHLAAWGIALTVLAAPIDELWHRLFGLDVSLWSPPHLLGFLGSAVNSAGCLLLACEVYPPGSRARLVAALVAGAFLYRGLHFTVEEAPVTAYLYGGVRFYLFAMLAALVLPLALVTTARLSDRRWAPVGVIALVLVTGVAGAYIARTGFAVLQPVSVIGDEIARDPTSPIAVANAIARKNGTLPGRLLFLPGLLAALAPAAVMVAMDARRRALAATMGYAVTLFAAFGWALGRQPAFQPVVPGAADTLLALLVTVAAALAGGALAGWLSTALIRSSPTGLQQSAAAPVS